MADPEPRKPESLPPVPAEGDTKAKLGELKETLKVDNIYATELVGEKAQFYQSRPDAKQLFLSRVEVGSEASILISGFETYKNQTWAAEVFKTAALKDPASAILDAELWASTDIVDDQGFMVQLAELKPELFLSLLNGLKSGTDQEVVFEAAKAAAKKMGNPYRVKQIIEESGAVLTEDQKKELYAEKIDIAQVAPADEPVSPPSEALPPPPVEAEVPAEPELIPDTISLTQFFNNFEKYKAAPNLTAFLDSAVDRGTENVYIRIADNFEKIEEAVGHDVAYKLSVKTMKNSAESVGYSWVPIKYFALHKDSDVLRAAIKRTQGAHPSKLVELYEHYKDIAEIDPKKIFNDAMNQLAKSRLGKADLIRLYPIYSKYYIDKAEADRVFETAVKDISQEDKILLADVIGEYDGLQKGTAEYTVGVGQKTKILHLIGESSEALASSPSPAPSAPISSAEVPASPGAGMGDVEPAPASIGEAPASAPAPVSVAESASAPARTPTLAPTPALASAPATATVATASASSERKTDSVWREKVGIRDEKQEARAEFYKKLADSVLKKDGADTETAIKNPAKFGLSTFEDLEDFEDFEHKIKQGDTLTNILNDYFKNTVGVKDAAKRKQEVALSRSYLAEQSINVDLLPVGYKISIEKGHFEILYFSKDDDSWYSWDAAELRLASTKAQGAPAAQAPQEGKGFEWMKGKTAEMVQGVIDKAKKAPQEGTQLPPDKPAPIDDGSAQLPPDKPTPVDDGSALLPPDKPAPVDDGSALLP